MALTGQVLCFRATVFEIQNKDRSVAAAMNITKVYLILCTACVRDFITSRQQTNSAG